MKLQMEATPVYARTWRAISNPMIKIVILRGGTRSSKTYSVMQMIATRLMSGTI